MKNRIVTNTEKTIDETIETGQIVRNGMGRAFELEVSEDTVTLNPLNNALDGKTAVLSRKVFCQLYYRKNYTEVVGGMDPLKDAAQARTVGGDRFLLK